MRQQYQEILVLIYVARKMVYLHTAVSLTARTAF